MHITTVMATIVVYHDDDYRRYDYRRYAATPFQDNALASSRPSSAATWKQTCQSASARHGRMTIPSASCIAERYHCGCRVCSCTLSSYAHDRCYHAHHRRMVVPCGAVRCDIQKERLKRINEERQKQVLAAKANNGQ